MDYKRLGCFNGRIVCLSIRRRGEIELQPEANLRICSSEEFYKLVFTRLCDHEGADCMVRRQGEALGDPYILDWLEIFEKVIEGLCAPQCYFPTGKL